MKSGFIILLIAFAFGTIIWGLMQKEPPPSSIEQKSFPYPIKIEGLSYSTYEKDRLIARIRADEFRVNPRRFWIFNIKPFNEATLINARLEVHLYENMPSEVSLFSFGKELLSLKNKKEGKSALKGMGLITRGVIKGLILKVYKTDRLSMVVKAKDAYIDFKKKKTKLLIASIEDVLSKKLIKASSIIWDNKEKVFKIPGEYMAQTPKGRASGKGIKIDLDFVVSPLRPQALQISSARLPRPRESGVSGTFQRENEIR